MSSPSAWAQVTTRSAIDYSRFDRLAALDSDDETPAVPSPQRKADPSTLSELHLVLGDLASAKVQWCYQTWGTGYRDLTSPWGVHLWATLGVLAHAVRTVCPASRDTWRAVLPRLPALLTPDVPLNSQGKESIETTRGLLAQAGVLATTPEIQLNLYARAMFGAQHRRVLPDRPDRAQLAIEIDELLDTKLRPHCQAVYWHVIMSTHTSRRVYSRAIHMPKHRAVWDAFLSSAFPWSTEETAKAAIAQVRSALDEIHAKLEMLNPMRANNEPLPSLMDPQRPVPTAVDAALAIYLAPIVCSLLPPHAVPSESIPCLPLPDPDAFPGWLKREAKELVQTHPLANWAMSFASKLDPVSGTVSGKAKSATVRGVKPPRYDRAARPEWTQWSIWRLRVLALGAAALWLLVLAATIVLPATALGRLGAVLSASLLGSVLVALAARSPKVTTAETRMRALLLLKVIQDTMSETVFPGPLKRKGRQTSHGGMGLDVKAEGARLSLKKSDSGSRLDDIVEEEEKCL